MKYLNVMCVVVSFLVFAFWMSLVGNPHVVETVIGLIISISAGVYLRYQVAKWLARE